MPRWWFLILVLASPVFAGPTTVRLHQSARLEPGAPVRLGDIATVRGEQREAIEALVVHEPDDGELRRARPRVEPALVRERLDHADGIDAGTVLLSGGGCALRFGPPPTRTPRAAPARSPVTAGPARAGSLRALVETRLLSDLGRAPQDVRISFGPDDQAWLAQPALNRLVEVTPLGSSDRIPMRVVLYEGDRIAVERTIRATVRVRTPAAVLKVVKRRNTRLTPEDLTYAEHWVGPGDAVLAPDRAAGAELRSTVDAGTILLETHVRAPVAAERGELVTVTCLSGSVVIKRQARALETGRDGEVIELESIDGSGGRFTARLSGKGRAVLIAAPTTPTPAPPARK